MQVPRVPELIASRATVFAARHRVDHRLTDVLVGGPSSQSSWGRTRPEALVKTGNHIRRESIYRPGGETVWCTCASSKRLHSLVGLHSRTEAGDQARGDQAKWVECLDHRRLLEPIGNVFQTKLKM